MSSIRDRTDEGVMMSRLILGVVLATLLTQPLNAQRRRGGDDGDYARFNVAYDGRFTFVRLRFDPMAGWSGGGGYFRGDQKWDHDYPRAERNLTKILDELTALTPYLGGSNILTAEDPELFKYPVAYLSEPGFWTVNDKEVENLRAYLLKGGFIIFDDFAGEQWYNFEEKMRRVLPEAQLVPLDPSYPIFHSFFDIEVLPAAHPYWGMASVYYGIFEDNDPSKRLMVIVNYNNDIGEYWEWSDAGFVPIELSNEAYKLGVNYIVYAMTH